MIEKIRNIKMTWLTVIIMAVVCGVVTAVIMLIPFLKDTSIRNIGVCFEFWFVPAVLIGINSKKFWEAGLKTFVFFLISQPLVYLIQVPFNDDGFGIFRFYIYWLIWTFLTIPGSILVWLGTKKEWAGILVTIPAVLFLSGEFSGHLNTILTNGFPNQTLACAFIIAEVIILTLIYTKKPKMRAISLILSAVIVISYTVLFLNFLKPDNIKPDYAYVYDFGKENYTVVSVPDEVDASMLENGRFIRLLPTKDGDFEVIVEDENHNKRTFIVMRADDMVDICEGCVYNPGDGRYKVVSSPQDVNIFLLDDGRRIAVDPLENNSFEIVVEDENHNQKTLKVTKKDGKTEISE